METTTFSDTDQAATVTVGVNLGPLVRVVYVGDPVPSGTLDSLANLAFLLAVREGELAVVAVITALYPAATVLLARAFLAERIGATQFAGLGLAAVAV